MIQPFATRRRGPRTAIRFLVVPQVPLAMDEGAGNSGWALVRTTVSKAAHAQELAQRLVASGLACCVHQSAIQSTYRWAGQMQQDEEWLVEARTQIRLARQVGDALREGHPYEVPLVEVVPIGQLDGRYAVWAEQLLQGNLP